jgi:hypothetical protein
VRRAWLQARPVFSRTVLWFPFGRIRDILDLQMAVVLQLELPAIEATVSLVR